MPHTRHVVFRNWAGIAFAGEIKWEASSVDKKNHLNKATWLTAVVETGAKFGSINSYDGAGLSAGLEQTIALFPKTMEQGELWSVLAKFDEVLPDTNPNWVALKASLDHAGWYLDSRGVLRNKGVGSLVGGTEIRHELSPPNGVVPDHGPDFLKAVLWAETFHNLLSDPATFQTQIRLTKNSLLLGNKVVESQVYRRYAQVEDASAAIVGVNIIPELDLAMCIYHSFSVNAPSKARSVLQTVLDRNLGPIDFSKAIVVALGNNTYANWKNRYTRTRAEAHKSGLFDESLFSSIAPAHL